MDPNLQLVLTQAFYYGLVMAMTVAACALLFRGYFWKYLRVRASLGRLMIVKVRNVLRDYFEVGQIEGSMLIFNHGKNKIRLAIPENVKPIYRAMGVNWIDVSEEKNSICTVDYKPVSPFGAIEYDNLLTEAVNKPDVDDQLMKIVIILSGLTLLFAIAAIYMSYMAYHEAYIINQNLPGMLKAAQTAANVIGG